jgi:hypothetical protein
MCSCWVTVLSTENCPIKLLLKDNSFFSILNIPRGLKTHDKSEITESSRTHVRINKKTTLKPFSDQFNTT